MNLLHVISSAKTTGGGPIEAVRLLSEAHSHAGHHVEIATLDAPGDNAAGDRSTSSFPLHVLGPGRTKYGYAPPLLAWLRAQRSRFDAVFVHGLWQYHSFAVWQALHATGTPYYVFPHGMLDPWFKRQYPLKHLKKWLYWPWADYRVLRDARAVLFTCEEERLLAPESFSLYRANAVVIGLGTAAPPQDLLAARSRFFAEFPSLAHQRLALFMGRLHPKKGCDLLIQAFAQTLASDPDWRLVMAGPDQVGWRAELEALGGRLGIADRITWTGMLAGMEKWGALAAAEVFVLPSHQENFGIAVAEALACATPVLISRQVNIWREVEVAGAGLVAEDTLPGASELLQGWRDLSADDQLQIRARALACFRERFDIEHTAAKILDLLAAR